MNLPFSRHAPALAAQPVLPSASSQHGQYLADALNQLQADAPSEIRTPGALGTNLLADALLQYGLRPPTAAPSQQVDLTQPMTLVRPRTPAPLDAFVPQAQFLADQTP